MPPRFWTVGKPMVRVVMTSLTLAGSSLKSVVMARRSGHLVNISSSVRWVTMPLTIVPSVLETPLSGRGSPAHKRGEISLA
ncbi:MAG: hypothetical protein MUF81_21260 [Verrucomicrobia bacterium]|nr:hypothetical protein [Verrucomicrobiota bacterium]